MEKMSNDEVEPSHYEEEIDMVCRGELELVASDDPDHFNYGSHIYYPGGDEDVGVYGWYEDVGVYGWYPTAANQQNDAQKSTTISATTTTSPSIEAKKSTTTSAAATTTAPSIEDKKRTTTATSIEAKKNTTASPAATSTSSSIEGFELVGSDDSDEKYGSHIYYPGGDADVGVYGWYPVKKQKPLEKKKLKPFVPDDGAPKEDEQKTSTAVTMTRIEATTLMLKKRRASIIRK